MIIPLNTFVNVNIGKSTEIVQVSELYKRLFNKNDEGVIKLASIDCNNHVTIKINKSAGSLSYSRIITFENGYLVELPECISLYIDGKPIKVKSLERGNIVEIVTRDVPIGKCRNPQT